MKRFFLILAEDGSIAEQIISAEHPILPAGPGARPLVNLPLNRIVEVERLGNLQFESLVDGEWVTDRDRKYESLAREIDDGRVAKVKDLEHRSPQISTSYQRKAAEAGIARRDTTYIKANKAEGKYPWIEAEATENGVPLEETLSTILEAAAAADAPVAAIHAKAVAFKKRLREAETVEDMLAIFEDTKKGA